MVSGIVEGLNSAPDLSKLVRLPNPSTHNNYFKIIIKRKHCVNIVYYCLPICFVLFHLFLLRLCEMHLWYSRPISTSKKPGWRIKSSPRLLESETDQVLVSRNCCKLSQSNQQESHDHYFLLKVAGGKKRPKSKRKWGTKRSRETFLRNSKTAVSRRNCVMKSKRRSSRVI